MYRAQNHGIRTVVLMQWNRAVVASEQDVFAWRSFVAAQQASIAASCWPHMLFDASVAVRLHVMQEEKRLTFAWPDLEVLDVNCHFVFRASRAFPIVCFGLFYLLRYITTRITLVVTPHTAPQPCRSTRTTLVLISALDNPF